MRILTLMRSHYRVWALLALSAVAWADDAERRVEALEAGARRDRRRIAELERRLALKETTMLRGEIEGYLARRAIRAGSSGSPDDHGADHNEDIDAQRVPRLRLSGVLLAAVGGSTADNSQLEALQGGGHDPRRRGFTLQQVELGLIGVLGERVRVEAFTVLVLDPVDGETRVELEEAFVLFQLTHELELEIGHFFSEFGRLNPLHPHERDFVDVPVVATRFFGEDGMRAPGVRVGGAFGDWGFHLGIQNAEGETMASFVGEGQREVDGLDDFVALLRVSRGSFGLSFATGPSDGSGTTSLLGLDVRAVRERFAVQAEAIARRTRADDEWGAYAQVLAELHGPWSGGLRAGVFQGTGDDRVRVSVLLTYQTEETWRVRAQLNLDDDDALGDQFVSVWFVIETALGKGSHDH